MTPTRLESGEEHRPRPSPVVLPDPPIGRCTVLVVVEHSNPLCAEFGRNAADVFENLFLTEPGSFGPQPIAGLHGGFLAVEGDETLLRQSNRHTQNGRTRARP